MVTLSLSYLSLVLSCNAPFVAYGLPAAREASSPQVNLDGTAIIGMSHTLEGFIGVEFFGGIPFAEPPVGDLRFAPPVEKASIGVSTLDATGFGAPCLQFNVGVVCCFEMHPTHSSLQVSGVSEDCLTLNVFRPSADLVPDGASLPVLVWIYGGGFYAGMANEHNGSAMVVQSILRGTPVIYVSLNYRVGPFGFPQGAEADPLGALNLGLKDQLAALSWIQKHIDAFGGDPGKVTVFGHSAGAVSIAHLYFNSGLEKYARTAIMQSGFQGTVSLFNSSRRQDAWDFFVSNIPSCANATQDAAIPCLRTASASELLASWEKAFTGLPQYSLFVPVLDGPDGLLPDLPSRLFAEGRFAKVPFIAGTVLDKGTLFTPQTVASERELVQYIALNESPFRSDVPPELQADIARLLQLYPDDPALGSPFGTGNETFGPSSMYKRLAALVGDLSFQAPRRAWIQAASAVGIPAFGYLFTDRNAVKDPAMGVAHGSEVSYVYGDAALTSDNRDVRMVSSAMLDYWLSFVVSLTPNDGKGHARTMWPQYEPDNQVLIQFDTTEFSPDSPEPTFSTIPDDYRAQQISFLNSVAADFCS